MIRSVAAAWLSFCLVFANIVPASEEIGFVTSASALPLVLPGDRQCTGAERRFTLVADTDSVVSVTNTSDAEITVIGIDKDDRQQVLGRLGGGETQDVSVPRGIDLLGFGQADGWLGDGYPVSGAQGEAVTVPFQQAADDGQADAGLSRMQQMQSGPGSVELSFDNDTFDNVTVVAVDAANNGYDLFDIPSAETITQRALPGTKLWFYRAGTNDVVGGPYVVAGTPDETVTVSTARTRPAAQAQSAAPETPAAPAMSPMQKLQSGPGGVEVSFDNDTFDNVTVVAVDSANKGFDLFDIPAAETLVRRALPGTKLWFYRAGTNDVVGGPYFVKETQGDVATVSAAATKPATPVAQAQPAQTGKAITSKMQRVQSGPGSVELSFVNDTFDKVTVVAEDESRNGFDLFDLPATETIVQRALPGTKLWFYRSGTDDVVGGPYLVAGTAGEVVNVSAAGAAEPVASAPAEPEQSALSEAQQQQAGPGSIEVQFVNTFDAPVTVAVRSSENGTDFLTEIPAGTVMSQRAQPGAVLWFYEGDATQPSGKPYVVRGIAGEAVGIPYDPAAAALAAVSGEGSIPVQLANTLPHDITVVTTDAEGFQQPLFDIGPGAARDQSLLPGTQLWFFRSGTEEPVSDAYVVPATAAGVISVPYVRLSAEAARQAGPGSTEVLFSNSSSEAIAVTSLNDANERVTLFSIGPAQQVTHRLQPGATLWFYRGDTQEFASRDLPYFVQAKPSEAVRLPYNPTDDELLALTDISIDKIIKEIAGKQDLSGLDTDGPSICWRESYGRGVGTIPRNCEPGKEEATPGLCYDKCRPGYSGFATMCVPSCPAGFRDDGLYCYKPAPYTRSAFPWEFGDGLNMNDALARCKRSADGRKYGCGIYNSNTMVYTECPSGYKTAPMLTNLCTPVCPSNTIDIGISCQKQTYDRGVGGLMSCSPGMSWDAGLCYNQCRPGFAGVGPVCWNECPKNLSYNCGAMCTRDKSTCDWAIADQVTGPVFAVGSVALTVLTAGGSTGATAAAKAGATAAKTGAQIAAKAAAKAAARETLKQSVRASLTAMRKAGMSGAKQVAIDTAIGAGLGTAIFGGTNIAAEVGKKQLRETLTKVVQERIVGEVSDERIQAVVDAMMAGAEKQGPDVDFPYTALDPTGIADIVIAYNHPICSEVK